MSDVVAELAAETSVEGDAKPTKQFSVYEATSEELIERSMAPIKKEFLCPPPSRSLKQSDVKAPHPSLVQEKKSKRQLKRERREKCAINLCPQVSRTEDVDSCQYKEKCRFNHDIEAFKAQKCAINLCPQVSRTEDVDSCQYKEKCRFNHDIEAFKAQKPDDIEGQCPFVASGMKCQYGLSCRFFGTHKDDLSGNSDGEQKNSEINFFNKETQRLLWKNNMTFVRADAKLKSLGLMGHAKKSNAAEENDAEKPLNGANGSQATEDVDVHGPLETEQVRPMKKAKSDDNNETSKLGDINDGVMNVDDETEKKGHSTSKAKIEDEEDSIKVVETDGSLKSHPREKKKLIDFRDKLYLAPLTTVGNLPFRRLCKVLGADVTCGEMAMCTNLLQGQASEWALLRRHSSEDLFGVQICDIGDWGATAVTIHGRSRQQRYSKSADWDYIYKCTKNASSNLQVIGNGDVYSFLDWNKHKSDCPELSSCMIARGALIKPWIFTEIKEQRHWDITSGERLNILKDFVRFGLQHWGSDTKGVETTRHFLLEWLSYTFRYIPVGLLDVIPQQINWRPPSYFGRDDLETLMMSESAGDWVRISELLLGKVPEGFTFAPKHKSNAYDRAENG
ncbi:hypothetical protein F2Q68_00028548 [Brassica cretica]|uniref:tRNA-dihydrouridine(47) synthase [NAD(P)(+)] n=1 Tax=Brassica cretica TaxID=69181 RepID=A0A8S9G3R5_BRACR|nr:hypothetical protein F2Q68_00028548 [Brassica cretica]